MSISTLNLQNQTGAYLFPSSSTDGKGKLFTESNTRDLTGKIQTRNYKELKSDFVFNIETNKISSGVAVINGYKIYIPSPFDIDTSVLEPNKTYDVNINIAKQDSTDGWIADTSNGGGVVYITYTEDSGSSFKTIDDVIKSIPFNATDGYDRYKVAINRNSAKNLNNIVSTVNFSNNFEDETLPVIDDNNCRFSSSLWVINRLNGLFVVDTDNISVDSINFNALYDGNRNNPTLKLTIGSVTTTEENSTVVISSVKTYNCVQRIDVDSIFVGDSTLSDYLSASGGLLKTHGSNVITSIRNTDNSYSDGGTGEMTEVPFIATVDSLFYKYNNDYDTKYLYVPYAYMGESYNEVECFDYDSSKAYQAGDIVKYEVSDVYKYYKCKVNETQGELPTDTDYWEEIERPFESDDVTDLQSIIECSFNSVPTTDNFSGTPYGSQILSVTSYNDCYTKYSYNILQRLYNGEDIDTKQCSLNEYRIGMYNPSNYLHIKDENEPINYTPTPPFGLYRNGDSNGTILIKTLFDATGTTTYDMVELKSLSTNGLIRLTANVTETTADPYDSTEKYEVEDTVSYLGAVWVCVADTPNPAGQWDINKWNISYVSSGNVFDVNSDSALFNIYNNSRVVSYAGFKNVSNEAVLEFYDGTNTSTIKLNGTDTYNTSTPVIEFSDNVKVTGYVRANRVYNAVYNDYAEWYNSNNAGSIYEGDIIYYNPETDSYESYSDNPATVVGVCSEKYGMIVGGKDIPNMEENRKDFIPVSLCGRVKIRLCNNEHFECGDYVYADGSPVGMKTGEHKIGKFLKYIDENYGIMQVFLA